MDGSNPTADALAVATAPVVHSGIDWTPVVAALSAVVVEWLQPLNVVLIVGLVLFGRFMHKANQRADFSLVDALRGDDGKCSEGRIFALIAVILGSWALMNCASSWQQKPEQFVEIFGLYMLILIAPKLLSEWIQAKYGRRDGTDQGKRQ